MHDRNLRHFIIITMIVPSTHDSVTRRENALGEFSIHPLPLSNFATSNFGGRFTPPSANVKTAPRLSTTRKKASPVDT